MNRSFSLRFAMCWSSNCCCALRAGSRYEIPLDPAKHASNRRFLGFFGMPLAAKPPLLREPLGLNLNPRRALRGTWSFFLPPEARDPRLEAGLLIQDRS